MRRIFKEVKNNKGKTYSVMITLTDDGEVDLDHSSCTCIFGSWFRFAGYWKTKGKLCRHMELCINEIKKQQCEKKK